MADLRKRILILLGLALTLASALTEEGFLEVIHHGRTQEMREMIDQHRPQIIDEILSKKVCEDWVMAEEDSRNVVHMLIDFAYEDLVQACLDNGTSTETKGTAGQTLLLRTIRTLGSRYFKNTITTHDAKLYVSILKLLISKGANVNARDRRGNSALCIAVPFAPVSVVKLLTDNGAHANMTCSPGVPAPLHIATRMRDSLKVALLLRAGADPNLKDEDGVEALAVAVAEGSNSVVETLLHFGANPDIARDGVTGVEFALREGHARVAASLLSAKCRLPSDRDMIYALISDGDEQLLQVLTSRLLAEPSRAWRMMRDAVEREDLQSLAAIPATADTVSRKDEGTTLLHQAVESKNDGMIRLLVNRGADVAVQDSRKATPIHAAVQIRCYLCLYFLLKGATKDALEIRNKAGSTPLTIAIGSGELEYARLLLEAGADINTKNKKGNTPMHMAIKANNIKLLNFLLSHGGIQLDIKNNDGHTPLRMAEEMHGGRVFEMLQLRFPNVQNSLGENALHVAVLNSDPDRIQRLRRVENMDLNAEDIAGYQPSSIAVLFQNASIVKSLLEFGVDPNAEFRSTGQTLLHQAVIHGNEEIMVLLAEWPSTEIDKCNNKGESPLHLATAQERNGLVKLLLHRRADPNRKNADGDTALHIALKTGNKKASKIIIDHFFTDVTIPDMNGKSPLQLCLDSNYPTLAEKILAKGRADVNARDREGQVLLHQAAGSEKRAMLKALVRHGAQVDLQDIQGQTAISRAIQNNDHLSVMILLRAGATVHIKDYNGDTPLHDAVYTDTRMLSLLEKEAHPDWNVVDQDGNTPLHIAALSGNLSQAKKLLSFPGVDKSRVNGSGFTASSLSKMHGFNEIARILDS